MSFGATTRAAADVDEIVSILKPLFPRHQEAILQAQIRNAFTLRRITHNAEKSLDAKNRLDFYLETSDGKRVAIETKTTAAGGQATARQLLRYALTEKIDEIILVTTRPLHLPTSAFTLDTGRVVPIHLVPLHFNAL